MKKEITVTSKGHCDLSGVRTRDHRFYLGEEQPDGTIILVPASLVPAKLTAFLPPDHEPKFPWEAEQ